MNAAKKQVRTLVRWTDHERDRVALRTVELHNSGIKEFGQAVKLAQNEVLPRTRHRTTLEFLANAGAPFQDVYKLLRGMSAGDLIRWARNKGLPILADDVRVEAEAEPVPPPAPAPTIDPAPTPTEVVKQELLLAAIPEGKVLLTAVDSFLLALLKPVAEQAVQRITQTVIIPGLQKAVDAQLESALSNAFTTAASRLQAQVNTTLDELTTPIVPPALVQQLATEPDAREKTEEDLKLQPSAWTRENNIRVFGPLPSQFQSVLQRLRGESWAKELDIQCTKDLTVLQEKCNSRSHVIQLTKLSAHLPQGFRRKVARIYPDARGIGSIVQLIKDIVEGRSFINSY